VLELIRDGGGLHFVGNDGPCFYLVHRSDAPRPVNRHRSRPTGKEHWRTILPENVDIQENDYGQS
jgi:hypothetical protein